MYQVDVEIMGPGKKKQKLDKGLEKLIQSEIQKIRTEISPNRKVPPKGEALQNLVNDSRNLISQLTQNLSELERAIQGSSKPRAISPQRPSPNAKTLPN